MVQVEDREQGLSADEVDEFADLLLDTLYALSPYAREGLMPVRLTEKPASFEKYPQMLFTFLEAGRSARDAAAAVREAFATWRSAILRKLDYLEIAGPAYARLEALGGWMVAHARGMCDRSTLRHLRRSMFGRTYAYLYPRLSLIMEYARFCQENGLLDELEPDTGRLRAVADPQFMRQHFAEATPRTQRQIEENLGVERINGLMQAAQRFLLSQQAYFEKVFRNKREKEENR
jgi:hypothetical protein